jgi:hypothetical protein
VEGRTVDKKMTVFWDVAPCSLVKFADVSEVLAASIIRVMIRLHNATSQKTLIFILAAVRTLNLT